MEIGILIRSPLNQPENNKVSSKDYNTISTYLKALSALKGSAPSSISGSFALVSVSPSVVSSSTSSCGLACRFNTFFCRNQSNSSIRLYMLTLHIHIKNLGSHNYSKRKIYKRRSRTVAVQVGLTSLIFILFAQRYHLIFSKDA